MNQIRVKIFDPPAGTLKKEVPGGSMSIETKGRQFVAPAVLAEATQDYDIVVWDRGTDVVIMTCLESGEAALTEASTLTTTKYNNRNVIIRAFRRSQNKTQFRKWSR